MKKKIVCMVRGRVQMVMYRDFTRRNAKRLGLVGVVENIADGSVYVEAEGDEKKLLALIDVLKKGPLLANVASVEVVWREARGNHTDFQIVY